ncbi:MAG: glucuronate isomerase [Balneolaceae bacterium]|nr:glucuronate isomerase [Balneolaceae bacterium]MBO6547319.1 glucuronate isomerase [Balneolaceae bacterium]MBO6647734.1 glucuronate isomerase [Balneolaceae bacterium]
MSSKPFIDENFLLQNKTAQKLYHNCAKDLPIIDYHCHLPAKEIAEDINFKNLTHIWLAGDHYKWRALRTCGEHERLITGEAPDKEKFLAWARTVPKTLKNPLFHWTHLELRNPFGITDRLLNEENAESIWEECNEMLQQPEFSARGILKKNEVKVVGTSDDPTDSLEHHAKLKTQEMGVKVVPTFRPDSGMEIEQSEKFVDWVKKLEQASDTDITTFQDFLAALKQRHDVFNELGCRASDHGIEYPHSESFSENQVSGIFSKVMRKQMIDKEDAEIFKSAFLYYCGVMDREKDWVMQLHIGPIRNNNFRMMKKAGKDAGFDSIGDAPMGKSLSKLLNRLDSDDNLPKTILYNSNPKDNELFSTMIGNFQDGSVPGKVQHGPPWWFLDQKDGMERHIESLSSMSILYEFVGMTTDSRSFLSYSRHDYFRRILCNILGTEVEEGLLPSDLDLLNSYITKICFTNANAFFRFEV